MRALVTGGGGFLGQYIVRQLLKEGYKVRIFCRGNYPELTKLGVEIVQGDIRNQNEIMIAGENQDIVFHTAAKVGVEGRYHEFYETNVEGTKNVLRTCFKNHIKKLVYTSSSSVTYDGKNHVNIDETLPYPKKFLAYYSKTKAVAEQLILASNGENGLLTCALRPHLVWGPQDKYIIPKLLEAARSSKLRIIGTGKNITDITYVENAAYAHILAGKNLTTSSQVPGQAYFITQGKPVVMWEWINMILKNLNLPPVTKHISPTLAYALGFLCEKVYELYPKLGHPPMTRLIARELATTHTYNIAKAKKDFAYEPRISTEEGLERLFAYCRSEIN